MSNGRFVKRGRVYQGWAKAQWALAGSSSPVVYTERIRLIGTSKQVIRVVGAQQ